VLDELAPGLSVNEIPRIGDLGKRFLEDDARNVTNVFHIEPCLVALKAGPLESESPAASKAYVIWSPKDQRAMVSRDDIFDEGAFQ
jgi:hypothetical protein